MRVRLKLPVLLDLMQVYITTELYWYNPQYLLALTSANDDGDGDGLCTVIVSLMQRMSVSKTDTFISFSTFQASSRT